MAAQNPPVNGVAYTVYISLQDFVNPGSYKANPTLAAGDVKISIDGGAFNNLTTLPAVTPAAGIAVKVQLSAPEMTGDNIFVQFIDQTNPKEWADFAFDVQTVASAPISAATVGAAVWDYLLTAITTVGSIGKLLKDDIDAAISSRSTYAGGAVASVTGNVGGNVAGSVGSVTGAVGSVTAPVTVGTNNDKTGYELSGTGNDAAADALLTRDLTAVAAPAARSPMNAIRKLMNRVGISGATLTVYQEDDATPAYTQTITQDASQAPIKSLDTN